MSGTDVMNLYLNAHTVSSTPLIFRRLALMALIGGTVGRKVYVQDGDRIVYPNMYVMLVGDSGSKKSTAIADAVSFMGMVGYKNFPNVRSSSDKFLDDFADRVFSNNDSIENLLDQDLSETKVTMALDEAQDFFCAGGSDIHSALIRLYDCPEEYRTSSRSAGDKTIKRPTLGFVGGATPQSLADIIPPSTYQKGLLSRMMLVCETIKPGYVPQPIANQKELASAARTLSNNLTSTGPMQLDPAAMQLINEMGSLTIGPKDSRLRSYAARRRDHLLKMAMVTAICAGKRVITQDILVYANSILTYCECTMHYALGGYGLSKNGAQSTEVLWSILHTDGILYQDDVSQRLGLAVDKLPDLQNLLGHLVHCGIVTLVAADKPYYTLHKRASYFQQFPEGVQPELLLEWEASNKKLTGSMRGNTHGKPTASNPTTSGTEVRPATAAPARPAVTGAATSNASIAERLKQRAKLAEQSGAYREGDS